MEVYGFAGWIASLVAYGEKRKTRSCAARWLLLAARCALLCTRCSFSSSRIITARMYVCVVRHVSP